MIEIGLAGWGDHQALYGHGTGASDKLRVYSRTFPIVEVDSSFYAIQPERDYEKWARETPPSFGFVVKAYQGMTGHQQGKRLPESEELLFASFRDSIQPLIRAGKLFAVLFQYPPWFDCTRKHVEELRIAKERMGDGLPLALEFRHQSWFEAGVREKTLAFMEREGWIHSICDEPQAGAGSVPIVPEPTHSERTIVRFHGRNTEGWNSGGQSNWRDVRYLYKYNKSELAEWADRLKRLEERTNHISVLFNNNSGGDAANNALELAELLSLPYPRPSEKPVQLDLF